MNSVVLCGRLTRDPDITVTANAKIARYTLAVDRMTRKEGGQNADFITCVAFNNGADFAERYLHRGTKILIDGRIQTGSYTNRDGNKVNTTEIIVQHHEFVEPRTGEPTAPPAAPAPAAAPEPQYQQTTTDDFLPIDDYAVDDEGLPWS